MRISIAIGSVVLLTFAIWAQEAGQTAPAAAPTAASYLAAADVAAMIAKSPTDKNALGQHMFQLAPYNVNMEHRVVPQAAAVHEKEAELFYIIDGSATIVTGGKLVEEKRTNATNLSGTSIEGGVSRKVSKGDWLFVPEGVPHQITPDGTLTDMSLHLPRN